MGLFSKSNAYSTEVRNNLVPKDGNIHVLLLNHFTRYINQVYPEVATEGGINDAVNDILSGMQSDGYEIIDVKLTSNWNDGKLKGEWWCYNTLIIYK